MTPTHPHRHNNACARRPQLRLALRRAARLAGLLGALTLTLSQSGCLRYEYAAFEQSKRFDLLYARELSSFERRLAAEQLSGGADSWTVVGASWLQLVNCRPLDEALPRLQGAPTLARLVLSSLVFEDRRRGRMLFERGMGLSRTALTGTLHARLDDQDFFNRSPRPVHDQLIVWPEASESWADELPTERQISSSCQSYYDRILRAAAEARQQHIDAAGEPRTRAAKPAKNKGQRFDELAGEDPKPALIKKKEEPKSPEELLRQRERSFAYWQRQELQALDQMIALAERGAPPQGQLSTVAWRARFHGAVLSISRSTMRYRLARMQKRKRLRAAEEAANQANFQRAQLYLAPLLEQEDAPAALPKTERGLTHFVAALLDIEQKSYNRAADNLRRAEQLGVSRPNRWSLRYLRLRLLERDARWQEAMAYADELPPRQHRLYSAYAYRAGLALKRMGLEDRFLAHSMSIFRDRAYLRDPFMRALYVQLLNSLADYVYEPRIVEILEDMGPRATTYERLEEYAAVALDRGRPENAEAAARFLLAKNPNYQYHARYQALLALASFLRDDKKGFETALAKVRDRPDELVDVLPINRRSLFFAKADEQFALILRQMLPVMAEWGEGKAARTKRQRWLQIIVDNTQRFLRQSPESQARPKLVELYRLASALLEEQPRNYPERVGRREPLPLVLGTVHLNLRNLEPYEPRVRPRVARTFGLAIVPRDTAPQKWSVAWRELLLAKKKKKSKTEPKKDLKKRPSEELKKKPSEELKKKPGEDSKRKPGEDLKNGPSKKTEQEPRTGPEKKASDGQRDAAPEAKAPEATPANDEQETPKASGDEQETPERSGPDRQDPR